MLWYFLITNLEIIFYDGFMHTWCTFHNEQMIKTIIFHNFMNWNLVLISGVKWYFTHLEWNKKNYLLIVIHTMGILCLEKSLRNRYEMNIKTKMSIHLTAPSYYIVPQKIRMEDVKEADRQKVDHSCLKDTLHIRRADKISNECIHLNFCIQKILKVKAIYGRSNDVKKNGFNIGSSLFEVLCPYSQRSCSNQ